MTVRWWIELDVGREDRDAFAALTAQMVAVADAEPGTLVYERLGDEDSAGATVLVHEAYADDAAALVHLDRFAADFAHRFEPLVRRRRVLVEATAGPALRARLAHLGPVYVAPVVPPADALTPHDVARAAAWFTGVARAVPDRAWGAPGGWSARRTLDHVVDALLLYSAAIATRATAPVTPVRNGDAAATAASLVDAAASASAVLVHLLATMAPGERATHPSGRADRSGWIGMACTELLVHGDDVALAAGIDVSPPPDELAARVVDRVLPWAPPGGGWARLRWATGRAPLDGRPAAGADWWWQSAPLDEWDGRPRRRDRAPQW